MGNKVKWTQDKLNILRDQYYSFLYENKSGQVIAILAAFYDVSRIRIYQLLKAAGVVIKQKKEKNNDSSVSTSLPS